MFYTRCYVALIIMKINEKNVLNPTDYKVLTQIVDMGNFYGKPYTEKYIKLDVDITTDDLFKPISFVFSTKPEFKLYWKVIGKKYGDNTITEIRIIENEQLKREYTYEELFPNREHISPITTEFYTFDELTNGVLV